MSASWLLLRPRAEWVVWGLASRRDQLPNAAAPSVDALNELSECFRFGPFRRNVSRDFPQLEQIKRFDSAQPGLERLPSAYLLVDAPACIDPASCRVRERPFFGIEAVAEINEMGAEVAVGFSAAEQHLPAVTVAQPFVQRKGSKELLPVLDSFE